MKKISLFSLGLGLLLNVLPAGATMNLEPLLNKVTLSLRSEQWVTTKTALVNVTIDASLSGQGMEKIQSDVLAKLNQIADKGDWHIVSFNRQLDKSGLENVQILAQARLPQTALALLREKAKSISKPGETYTLADVQFTPDEEELRLANAALRSAIYQQAKAELDTLNKAYPDQKYYLHQIDFITMSPMPMRAMALSDNAMFGVASKAAQMSTPLAVGNKLELQASVVLASTPDLLSQKLSQTTKTN